MSFTSLAELHTQSFHIGYEQDKMMITIRKRTNTIESNTIEYFTKNRERSPSLGDLRIPIAKKNRCIDRLVSNYSAFT